MTVEDEELLHEVEEELNKEAKMADAANTTAPVDSGFKKWAGLILFAVAVVGAAWGGAAYLFVTDKNFQAVVSASSITLQLLDKDTQQLRKEIDDLKDMNLNLIRRHGYLDRRVIRLEVREGMTALVAERAPASADPPARAPAPKPAYKSRVEPLLMQYKK